MSMPQRLELVRALQRGPAQRFERGFARWNVIESFLEVFIAHGLGAPGTWASYGDAANLEALVRGLALALKTGGGDYGNPGARLWARYLNELKAGRLAAKPVHNVLWSNAEQTSVDWGTRPDHNPATPNAAELTLFSASQFYRLILRNEPTIVLVLRTLGQPKLTRCYDWLTDTTNRKAVRTAGDLLATLATEPANAVAVAGALGHVAAFYPECAQASAPRRSDR